MPISVQRSVRKQNIKFLHNRIHFSPEYFHFIKRLVQSNVQVIVNHFQNSSSPQHQTEKSQQTNVNVRFFFSSPVDFLFVSFFSRRKRSKNWRWSAFKSQQNFSFRLVGEQKKLFGLSSISLKKRNERK